MAASGLVTVLTAAATVCTPPHDSYEHSVCDAADSMPSESCLGTRTPKRHGLCTVTMVHTVQVSYAESEFAAYTGHKYCVGLNSCGSAIFLALYAAGVKEGDTVLSNALTFNAVPSAIHHARANGVLCTHLLAFVQSLRLACMCACLCCTCLRWDVVTCMYRHTSQSPRCEVRSGYHAASKMHAADTLHAMLQLCWWSRRPTTPWTWPTWN